MTKKEYLLYILNSLEKDWDIAKWLKIIINDLENKDDKILNELFNIFKSAILKVNDKKILQTFNKSFNKLKQIRAWEQELKDLELKSLEEQMEKLIL